MPKHKIIPLDVEIDKLTNSVENTITGDSHPTNVSLVTQEDLENVKNSKTWNFDWSKEHRTPGRKVYKLTVEHNPDIIQGLISIEIKPDHVYMHLIESAKFNIGKNKAYLGVPGNLAAFACKVAFEKGFDGNVAFVSKTNLVEHYQKTLGAHHFRNNLMIIYNKPAQQLIDRYFNK